MPDPFKAMPGAVEGALGRHVAMPEIKFEKVLHLLTRMVKDIFRSPEMTSQVDVVHLNTPHVGTVEGRKSLLRRWHPLSEEVLARELSLCSELLEVIPCMGELG